MYENNALVGGGIPTYPEDAQAKQRRLDVTMRQNIDAQIKAAEDYVTQLKETKARLESSGILDTRIDDIQRAMRF